MALVSSFASWRSLSTFSMLRRISSLPISSSSSFSTSSSSSSSSATFLRNTSWQITDRKPQVSMSSLPQLIQSTQQTQRRRYSTSSPPPSEEATRLALNNISSTSGISQVFVPRELNFDSVPVYNWQLEQVNSIAIPRSVFGSPLRTDILHRVLVWEQAGKRQGTHQAKGRGDVNGSTRKLAAQKKRGTARVGGKNPPHHRGGGHAFPPRPRDHSFDLPAKVVKYGLRVALSTRFAEDQLFLMEPMKLESHKTKLFYKLMVENHNLDSELILLIGGREVDRNLYLASKCIPKVNLLAQNQINVYDILRHQRLLLSVEALPYLTNRLAPESYTKTFIVPPFVPPTTTLLLPPTTSFPTDTSSSSTNSTTSL